MDNIINPTKYRWCAVVLSPDSHRDLLGIFKTIIPENWVIHAHHMTIDPFNPLPDTRLLNSQINLLVTTFGISQLACCVKVTGYNGRTNNKFPHVTLAVNAAGGGAAKNSNDITEWTPLSNRTITLTGTIQNLT
jgi:hypothetical protein